MQHPPSPGAMALQLLTAAANLEEWEVGRSVPSPAPHPHLRKGASAGFQLSGINAQTIKLTWQLQQQAQVAKTECGTSWHENSTTHHPLSPTLTVTLSRPDVSPAAGLSGSSSARYRTSGLEMVPAGTTEASPGWRLALAQCATAVSTLHRSQPCNR